MNNLREVDIVSYDKDGKGICYIDGKITFVEGALINEKCLVKVFKETKKVNLASLEKVLIKNESRVESDCPYYPLCGGCQLRHINYETEAKVKQDKVYNTIVHQANQKDFKMNDIIKADNLYNYRNKAIIPFQKINKKIVYGMYENKSHNIVSINKCLIEPTLLPNILEEVKLYLEKENISIYDETTKKGIFRGLMLRKNVNNEYLVVLISTVNYDFKDLALILKEKFKEIISIYLNINTLNNNVMLGYDNRLICGEKLIYETILGHKFGVSVNTFLQVNHDQTEKLYQKAIDELNPNSDDIVIDCYCGMGSITLSIAPKVKEIYGIEVVDQAIINAKDNAKLNNITNAYFECGKCEDLILKYVKKHKVTKIVFDPPRKGCEQSFLDVIKESKIKTIVYVSCNVASLARDIKYLSDTYNLISVTPVDLFPRTNHVECVCRLEKKSK